MVSSTRDKISMYFGGKALTSTRKTGYAYQATGSYANTPILWRYIPFYTC